MRELNFEHFLQVVGARVSGNVAQDGGALMAAPYRMPYADSDRHTLELKHVTFRDNEATANGGAVATDSFTHAVLDNCSFFSNAAGTSAAKYLRQSHRRPLQHFCSGASRIHDPSPASSMQ